jgi:serine/threonine protein kinase
MDDAIRPDEFRQRFAAAAQVQHPNIAATHEVLEIHGRPAVLQEWTDGLAASDWPSVFAVPGVCLRLLKQATSALQAVHASGMVHGHLHPSLMMLTADGTLKIGGLGEPFWLAAPETVNGVSDQDLQPPDDISALGHVFQSWLPSADKSLKKPRAKAKCSAIADVVYKMVAKSAKHPYAGASEVLADLERLSANTPPGTEAWEQLLRHVRENTAFEKPALLAG